MTARLRTGTSTIDDASNALANSLNDWFTKYGPTTIFKNCANCVHMTEHGTPVCALFNTTPPASVIVVGCERHADKEAIPF